ncbi:long-chain-fatty-acid--CoA ligase 1 isoform X2 [Parasteatoda tepidariorum]|uniref:long-chain-fatty-acid--CoA ligase 1 isoform X2 n=1 Tax=Parasteatoda tepidariorum TaxID=114398 RepID=UPI00077F86B4|nr:long-chain-fatty-acid--CoA ligase 1 [Parasteatoda tepidariorum]
MAFRRSLITVNQQLRVLGGVYYRTNRNYNVYSKGHYKPSRPVAYDKQSVLLPGPERLRASVFADDPHKVTGSIPGAPEVKTVYDTLTHGLKVSNDGPCIGSRPPGSEEYHWQSYSEVLARTQNIGSGLIKLGLKPVNDSSVGIFAANREEFLLSMYACSGYSMVLVPLYLTLGLPSILYIINHANLSVVITTNSQNTMSLLNNVKSVPKLKSLILCEDPTEEQLKMAKDSNIDILKYSELEEMGKTDRRELVVPQPDDKFMIPFTSGTTGVPKGAILTHANLISCVASLVYGYGTAGIFGGCIISYLPTAHVYEIVNEVASMYFARCVAFYSGNVQGLMEEVRRVKPTILPVVPRLMTSIYLQALMKIKESKIKTALLPLAMKQKEKLLKKGILTKSTIWDKYVFKDFQEQIGGNVFATCITSAPVPQDVMHFFSIASGGYVFEAYGSTEVLAAVMTLPKDMPLGFVGSPMVCNHIKLVDVPDMGYFSKDDTGEVCMKGVNVFKGYLDNPEATNEALKDGWYHSGDIGKWLPNGALKIIDRKKHLFKLSQGEYIAPEKVENAYSFCPYVFQIFVDGFTDKDYAITLVVPEPTMFKKWLVSKGYADKMPEILSSKELRKEFLLMLHAIGIRKHLNPLEQAKNLAFLSEPFTFENDQLTPTYKVKRNVVRKHYEHLYKKLYEEGPLVSSSNS